MDRARADWLHYKAEASLAALLDDRGRTEQMQSLFEAFLAFQRSKSPEEIARERMADRRLNRAKLNPRYRALLDEANRAARSGDGRPADR
jgi:hypothetical protein